MVSLKTRSRAALLEELRQRTAGFPLMLNPSDFEVHVTRAVRRLDSLVFIPRAALFQAADVVGGFVDVTDFYIDEVSVVYFSSTQSDSLLAGMDLGIGVLPIILGGTTLSSVGNLIDYYILQSNLNAIQRRVLNTNDWYIWPIDANGRQKMQIKGAGSIYSQGLFSIEFLPYFNPSLAEWNLYEPEYAFIQELAFCYIGEANAEAQLQATLLGVSDKAQALTTYWAEKIKALETEFTESNVNMALYY